MEENNKILDKHIGLRIRERRKMLNMTQAELADIMGLSHQQIQRYESGENTISMARILILAHHLDTAPDFFYKNAPLPGPDNTENDKIIRRDSHRPLQIMLIDDDENDVLLFRKAVEQSGIPAHIRAHTDGEKALENMLRDKNDKAALSADVVVLDINMPRLNGLELLKKIKADAGLRDLPVIMLTNSVRSKDMLESYANYANGFVQKNADLLEFYEDIRLILSYWSKAVVLPSAA